MSDFSRLTELTTHKGKVTSISANGKVLWNPIKYRYVSFGDSIAVGHRIDENWENDYGWNAQYGVEGRTQTTLVTGCYTDIIRQKLKSIYGANSVSVTSFAKSGDKVSDLMDKLTHTTVQNALKNADLATICIGANDVLTYALFGLSDYLTTGDLSTIDAQVNASLAVLNDDNASTSYWALLNRLKSVNPNAKYVFTTVYNPYKYLWIDGSTDGFFEPMLNYIKIDPILGIDVGEIIKQNIMSTSEMTTFISRINKIHEKAEEYVTRLNTILRNKITAFQASNPNFILADTKSLFDSIPDRQGAGQLHYNDLVNVEYTRGFNTADIRWYPLWTDEYGENPQQYWTDLATRHTSLEKGFDIMGFARDLVPQIAEKIIEPNVDPHPEKDGHYAMYRAFVDTLGWESLNTITYNANGGAGSMKTQKVLDYSVVDGARKSVYSILTPNTFTAPNGYRFTGWGSSENSGIEYSNCHQLPITRNRALYANWSNQCIIRYNYSKHTDWVDILGAKPENYQLWVDGSLINKLSDFGQENIFAVPYGSSLGAVVSGKSGVTFTDSNGYVTYNGEKVTLNADNGYNLPNGIVSDLVIDFQWRTTGVEADITPDVPKTSFYDCHIDDFDASYETLRQLFTLKYDVNAENGGKQDGTAMPEQKLLQYNGENIKTLYKSNIFASQEGWYYLNKWKDQNGKIYEDNVANYSSRQPVLINFNAILYAQWSDLYTLTIKQAYRISEPDISVQYDLRKVRVGKPNAWKNIYISEDLTRVYGAYTTQTVDVHYNDRVQMYVGGMVTEGNNLPDCGIYRYNRDDAEGNPIYDNIFTVVDGAATGYFLMPNKNVEIELWYNRAFGWSGLNRYEQRYWNGYVNNSKLAITQSTWD